jgi:hypothetical protein
VRAPASDSSPPKIQTKKTMPGDPVFSTIVFGTRKIPLPMMVPTTIATVLQTPSARSSSTR